MKLLVNLNFLHSIRIILHENKKYLIGNVFFFSILALLYKPEDLTSPNSPAGKRTDVDHVFLRFGRRR